MPFSFITLTAMVVVPYIVAKFLVSRDFSMPKNILNASILVFCTIFFIILSLFYNSTSDFLFVKTMISFFFAAWFSAYFLVLFINRLYGKINFEILADFYIIAADIQIVLSILFFIFPKIGNVAYSLLWQAEVSKGTFEYVLGKRLLGFGAQFFGGGVKYGFVLLLIAAILKNNILPYQKALFYSISFLLIFLLGMMTSRTTFVGGALAMLILCKKGSVRNTKKILFYVVFFGISIISIFLLINERITGNLIKFGYKVIVDRREFLRNINLYLKMQIFPDTFKTWIIGDGYLMNPKVTSELSYYMGTDVGYSRLLFYFGIIGTFFYFCANIYLIHCAKTNNKKKYAFFFLLSAVLLIIVNLKGLTSLSILIAPFLFLEKKDAEKMSSRYFSHNEKFRNEFG
jgi:hypothetical protein